MYLDTEEKQKMSSTEKLQKIQFQSSQCAPMSELTGGEIFDALSVLADNPEYLAEILDGRDGIDGGSWGAPATARPGAASGEDKGGGGGRGRCCCGVDGGRGEVAGMGTGGCVGGLHGYGGGYKTVQRCDNLVSSCGSLRGAYSLDMGLTATCNSHTVMNHHPQQQQHQQQQHHHDNSQHQHNSNINNNHMHNPHTTAGSGLPPPPLTIPIHHSTSPPTSSSWADPGGQGGGLEAADHSLMYRADLYYSATSGSESGGDTTSSCSPGYDAASVPPMDFTLSALDVHSLKDLTLNLKQEPLSRGSTLDPCAYTIYNTNLDNNNLSKAHLQQPLPQCPPTLEEGCSVALEEVKPAPADLAPYTPDSPEDGSGLEDGDLDLLSDSLLSDGEMSTSGGRQSKMKSMKPDRRLRRREQNRQAARRCRQRKKEQSQELVKEYYQLLSANSEMQSKLKVLESEKQRLKDIYEAHLATCTVHLVNTANCK